MKSKKVLKAPAEVTILRCSNDAKPATNLEVEKGFKCPCGHGKWLNFREDNQRVGIFHPIYLSDKYFIAVADEVVNDFEKTMINLFSFIEPKLSGAFIVQSMYKYIGSVGPGYRITYAFLGAFIETYPAFIVKVVRT